MSATRSRSDAKPAKIWVADPRQITDSQIRNALRLIAAGEPAAQAARDLGMSRATLYRRAKTIAP